MLLVFHDSEQREIYANLKRAVAMMVTSFLCEIDLRFAIVKEVNLADSISHAIITSHQDMKARVQSRKATEQSENGCISFRPIN